MKRIIMAVLLAAVTGSASAADPACFLKEGDVWVFHGDSITHADTYRRLVEQVFRHYHPDAKVAFVQAGVWGSSSSDAVARMKAEGRKPTVVSLMTGMNNAINSQWTKGMPREKPLDAYRKDLTAFVRKNKEAGAAVILMSPTLTDETCRRTFFRIAGGTEYLRDCRDIANEVAAAEGAFYVPVQEEFEAFQESLGPRQRLRPDGVHPASLGEYRIGRSLCEWLNLDGPLAGDARALAAPAKRLPVTLSVVDRRLPPSASGLSFTLTPAAAFTGDVKLAWSLGELRGGDTVAVTGKTSWSLSPPAGLPFPGLGQSTNLLIDMRAGGQSALCVVDLATVPVLHVVSNMLSGTVESAVERPEGKRVADWRLEANGAALDLVAEVVDSQNECSSEWAYGRDGLTLFLDLRPADRFGDINLDDDVHQVMVNYYEQPFVSAVFRPWLGAGLDNAAVCGGEKTAAGYRIRLRLSNRLNLQEPFALDKRDFLGLALAVTDADPDAGGKAQVVMHEGYPVERARDQFANSMSIIDLKNKWPGDRAVNASVFPLIGVNGP